MPPKDLFGFIMSYLKYDSFIKCYFYNTLILPLRLLYDTRLIMQYLYDIFNVSIFF